MEEMIFIGFSVVLFITFMGIHMKHKTPIRVSILTMILGTGSLAAASYLLSGYGIILAVNIYTVLISLCLGFPGVGMILLYLYCL